MYKVPTKDRVTVFWSARVSLKSDPREPGKAPPINLGGTARPASVLSANLVWACADPRPPVEVVMRKGQEPSKNNKPNIRLRICRKG